ncbi:hypothetical protein IQ266_08565 [filamentous cyanobacterium LEGE 11480]|uniref:Uncharacterized protein n=1 Tax=Romeriopsis navalis LEGE 11480 TaxID=2777977 RepID=A0A928Z3Y7_9CYAN|nr:hypothetical protein [Romeriopsis navalis]MBE9029778.1 hypothetical protein [Romeriopsis navalis LEGE 11480]
MFAQVEVRLISRQHQEFVTDQAAVYLQRLQQFELEPRMINLLMSERRRAYPWIGANIDRVNQALYEHLVTCQECFFPANRCAVSILAAPIGPEWGIDGFCNVRVDPSMILVDVGRIVPTDWLKLVAHEYAHAMIGSAGHASEYAAILKHLCLGLGFTWDEQWRSENNRLQTYPPCISTLDPIAFWRGDSDF